MSVRAWGVPQVHTGLELLQEAGLGAAAGGGAQECNPSQPDSHPVPRAASVCTDLKSPAASRGLLALAQPATGMSRGGVEPCVCQSCPWLPHPWSLPSSPPRALGHRCRQQAGCTLEVRQAGGMSAWQAGPSRLPPLFRRGDLAGFVSQRRCDFRASPACSVSLNPHLEGRSRIRIRVLPTHLSLPPSLAPQTAQALGGGGGRCCLC